eukprot:CAMPEP_0172779754 /NCGR_PEP_ID=MMETSP1074-20121228/202582_1 /TAXON_ID=2916 /ORGANISM="Ceratium fusus, Strain PA161109" /LENGTH=103 /DNA_ID=CAMNT_0013616719 /DNA_START=707 /DNA_END=1019 /DNA_ORIENTATION=+
MDGIVEWWGTSGPKPDDGVKWDDIKFVTRAKKALMDGIIEWWGTSGPKPDDGVTWDDIKFVTRAKQAGSDKRRSAAASASSQPSVVGDAAWPRRVGCLFQRLA